MKGEWKSLPARSQINPFAAESTDAEIVTAQQKPYELEIDNTNGFVPTCN